MNRGRNLTMIRKTVRGNPVAKGIRRVADIRQMYRSAFPVAEYGERNLMINNI